MKSRRDDALILKRVAVFLGVKQYGSPAHCALTRGGLNAVVPRALTRSLDHTDYDALNKRRPLNFAAALLLSEQVIDSECDFECDGVNI
jgi:hypothetical protein